MGSILDFFVSTPSDLDSVDDLRIDVDIQTGVFERMLLTICELHLRMKDSGQRSVHSYELDTFRHCNDCPREIITILPCRGRSKLSEFIQSNIDVPVRVFESDIGDVGIVFDDYSQTSCSSFCLTEISFEWNRGLINSRSPCILYLSDNSTVQWPRFLKTIRKPNDVIVCLDVLIGDFANWGDSIENKLNVVIIEINELIKLLQFYKIGINREIHKSFSELMKTKFPECKFIISIDLANQTISVYNPQLGLFESSISGQVNRNRIASNILMQYDLIKDEGSIHELLETINN
jgi:hypothetical protein